MLRVGKQYTVNEGKVTTSGKYTKFNIKESERDPQTGEWKTAGWWNLYVSGQYPCEWNDRVKFKLSAITGIMQREYNGKNYYTIFADGTIEYKGQVITCGDIVQSPKNDGGQVIGVTEDLPF